MFLSTFLKTTASECEAHGMVDYAKVKSSNVYYKNRLLCRSITSYMPQF